MATRYRMDDSRSVLSGLRALIPVRRCRFAESLRIAELQASRLLELTRVEDAPIPSEVVSELPRIEVRYRDLPVSGLSYWNGQAWIICLNRREPWTRQRFTLLHEYKHIVDHGAVDRLYVGSRNHSAAEQAEQAADYFAGCVLMPRRLMKRAWVSGLQRPATLAGRFQTSERAIAVRLAQLGLVDDSVRCRGTMSYPTRSFGRRHQEATA